MHAYDLELLLKTCEKLSYLPASKDALEEKKKFQSHWTFSNYEQLEINNKKLNFTLNVTELLMHMIQNFWSFDKFPMLGFIRTFVMDKLSRHVFRSSKGINNRHMRRIKDFHEACIVPLVHFNSYYVDPTKKKHTEERVETKTIYSQSLFMKTAAHMDDDNIFNDGDIIIEKHKWEQFAKLRFISSALYTLSIICLTLLVFPFRQKYFITVLDLQLRMVYSYFVCLMFVSGSILFIQECRQFLKIERKWNYVLSLYNWIDIASFIFPIVMMSALIQNKPYLVSTHIKSN